MGLIKKTVVVFLLITLNTLMISCKKTNNKTNVNEDKIEITSLSINTNITKSESESSRKKYLRVKEISKNGDQYVFDFFSVSLTEREGEDVFFKQDLNIIENNKKTSFKIDDDFDLGEFYLWVYKLDKKYVFLLELDDYTDSVFYAYHLLNGCLVRLGDLSIQQPNIEAEGIKKESFIIEEENELIFINTFLNEKPLSDLKMKLNREDCISFN